MFCTWLLLILDVVDYISCIEFMCHFYWFPCQNYLFIAAFNPRECILKGKIIISYDQLEHEPINNVVDDARNFKFFPIRVFQGCLG